MRTRFLLIFAFFAFCGTLSAALTERYCSVAGAGAHNGTIGNEWTLAEALTNAAAGDRVNVKAGTYTQTADATPTNAGTAAAGPIVFRGYSSVITDGYLGRTNGNGALITTNFPVFAYDSTHEFTTKAFNILENISFTAVNATTSGLVMGADSAMINCKMVNSSNAATASGIATAARVKIINCDINVTGSGATPIGIPIGANVSVVIHACRLNCTGATAVGITFTSGSGVISNCTFFGCGSHAIASTSTTPNVAIINNTIVGNGGDGINILTGSSTLACIIGNMITDNTGDGVDMVSVDNAAIVGYNRYRDNANSIANGGEWIDASKWGDVDSGTTGTTATDYTNYAGNDYSLIATSPAVSVGTPLYMSIGALQRLQTTTAAEYSFGFAQ